MVRITNANDLGAWLKNKPETVGLLLAVRAGLRAMPLLEAVLHTDADNRRREVILPLFRSIALATSITKWPTMRVTDASVAAERAAAAALAYAAKAGANSVYAAAGVRYAAAVAAAASSDAAPAADVTAAWSPLSGDAEVLETAAEKTGSPELLMSASLWHRRMPDWAGESWKRLKAHLLDANEGWDVWTEWYEDRLRGRPAIEALDAARAEISNEEWKKGPAHVNAIIKRLIEEHTPEQADTAETNAPPELPEARPAPVQFEFRDGALRKAMVPLADLPGDRERIARQAWQALDALVSELLAADPGRNSPRLARVLAACRSALGTAYDELAVVALGVHAARLQGFAERADEVLLPEDAAELIALNAQLGLFLGQFPDWAEYARGLSDGFGSPQAEAQAVADGVAAIETIEAAAPGIIAPDAKQELAALADAATPEPSADGPADASPLSRRSFLRSLRSGLVALAGGALVSVRAGARKGIEKHVESTVAGALSGAQTSLLALAAGLPGEFGWLAGVVTYLTRMVGPSRQADTRSDDDIASA